MNTDLRERRRRQTAREIQTAALRLALDQGLGAVTTEAIAHEAGISPRTFFNYFPNKQAALIGPQPSLDDGACAFVADSDRPVIEDMVAVVDWLVRHDPPDRHLVRMFERMLADSPEMARLFRDRLDALALMIGAHLQRRLGAHAQWEADILAQMTVHALGNAVREWAASDVMAMEDLPVMVRAQLRGVCARLSEG